MARRSTASSLLPWQPRLKLVELLWENATVYPPEIDGWRADAHHQTGEGANVPESGSPIYGGQCEMIFRLPEKSFEAPEVHLH